MADPTVKFDKGTLTVTLPVNAKEGTMSTSGKSLVLGGATIRDVNIGGELVRVSISVYVPLKQPKAAQAKDDKVKMTLAEARKAANS